MATLVTVAASVFFSGAALYSSSKQDLLTRQTAISERYSAAVEMIGSESLSVRVGGIYSLGSLADESTERINASLLMLQDFIKSFPFSTTIVKSTTFDPSACPAPYLIEEVKPLDGREILFPNGESTGLRVPDPNQSTPNLPATAPYIPPPRYTPSADLRAAVRVLGFEPSNPSFAEPDVHFLVPLTDVCLVGIDISGADLAYDDLTGSILYEANFTDADLTGTSSLNQTFMAVGRDALGRSYGPPIFRNAKLQSIDFTISYEFYGLDVDGATFADSTFYDLDFGVYKDAQTLSVTRTGLNGRVESNSNKLFAGADLSGASFRNVNLVGADLRDAKNLDRANLEGIYYNDSTQWPESFDPPESADCYVRNEVCTVYK